MCQDIPNSLDYKLDRLDWVYVCHMCTSYLCIIMNNCTHPSILYEWCWQLGAHWMAGKSAGLISSPPPYCCASTHPILSQGPYLSLPQLMIVCYSLTNIFDVLQYMDKIIHIFMRVCFSHSLGCVLLASVLFIYLWYLTGWEGMPCPPR